MIFKRVPKINDELSWKAKAYSANHQERVERLFIKNIGTYSRKVRNDDKKYMRENSLKKTINVYLYLKDNFSSNPHYSSYIETLDEILDRGLITDSNANMPYKQFTTRAFERLSMDILSETVKSGIDFKLPKTIKGKHDWGVDVIMTNKDKKINIDVKSVKYNSLDFNKEVNLGTLKQKHMSWDNKTDYYLWTGNLLEKGVVFVMGWENQELTKQDFKEDKYWKNWVWEKYNLPMTTKEISDLKENNKVPLKFLGNFPNKIKRKIINNLIRAEYLNVPKELAHLKEGLINKYISTNRKEDKIKRLLSKYPSFNNKQKQVFLEGSLERLEDVKQTYRKFLGVSKLGDAGVKVIEKKIEDCDNLKYKIKKEEVQFSKEKESLNKAVVNKKQKQEQELEL